MVLWIFSSFNHDHRIPIPKLIQCQALENSNHLRNSIISPKTSNVFTTYPLPPSSIDLTERGDNDIGTI